MDEVDRWNERLSGTASNEGDDGDNVDQRSSTWIILAGVKVYPDRHTAKPAFRKADQETDEKSFTTAAVGTSADLPYVHDTPTSDATGASWLR